MTIQLVLENGDDYRHLPEIIEAFGYEYEREAGHARFTMADGTQAVYSAFVETHAGDTQFIEHVQTETEGTVEARPQ